MLKRRSDEKPATRDAHQFDIVDRFILATERTRGAQRRQHTGGIRARTGRPGAAPWARVLFQQAVEFGQFAAIEAELRRACRRGR